MADHSISITGISLLPDEWAAELQYPDWVARRFSKIHHSLQVLSNELGEQDYFHGNTLSLADIAVVSALGYVGLRYADNFSWQDKYPVLARFMRAGCSAPRSNTPCLYFDFSIATIQEHGY